MLKVLFSLLITLSLVTYFSPTVFAQDTPVPTPEIRFTNNFTVENEPNAVISLLKNFVTGFDSFLGGFIFYTPNPFADKITLKDNSEIDGIGKYRSMFMDIAIPTVAIIIAGIALSKIRSDNALALKSFFLRLLIVAVLFLTVPLIFSYSIQANNLLVSKIETTQSLTSVLNTYLDKTQEKIDEGASADQFGIPSFNISLAGGILKSLGNFIVQVFLFLITFLFLIIGLFYIGFQFVIRFAMLLFLSVLYPIVIPFFLSERTSSIVNSYFKSWFSALIAQPAFVLGYAITADIFISLLTSKGPSVGMLFFYTGFLFFLGAVTMLVAKIFGEAWNISTINARATFATSSIRKTVSSATGVFKNPFARQLPGHAGKMILRNTGGDLNGSGGGQNGGGGVNYRSFYKSMGDNPKGFYLPQFSQRLKEHGLKVSLKDRRQGIVKVSGEAYTHHDTKAKITSIYPSREDAVADGITPSKLSKTTLKETPFIDTSAFSEKYPSPHNRSVYFRTRSNDDSNSTSYLTQAASQDRVKNFLEVNRGRNKAYGVKGVIVKRYGDIGNGKDREFIRIYTDEKL